MGRSVFSVEYKHNGGSTGYLEAQLGITLPVGKLDPHQTVLGLRHTSERAPKLPLSFVLVHTRYGGQL